MLFITNQNSASGNQEKCAPEKCMHYIIDSFRTVNSIATPHLRDTPFNLINDSSFLTARGDNPNFSEVIMEEKTPNAGITNLCNHSRQATPASPTKLLDETLCAINLLTPIKDIGSPDFSFERNEISRFSTTENMEKTDATSIMTSPLAINISTSMSSPSSIYAISDTAGTVLNVNCNITPILEDTIEDTDNILETQTLSNTQYLPQPPECSSLDPCYDPSTGHGNKNEDSEPCKVLKSIRISHINRLIIGQLNINSIRNKFEALKYIVSGNMDVLVVTESKLDESFPASQFSMEGFSPPFRLD